MPAEQFDRLAKRYEPKAAQSTKSRQSLEHLTEQVTYPYSTFVVILVGENKPFEKVFASGIRRADLSR